MQPSSLLLAVVASMGFNPALAHPQPVDAHLEHLDKRACFLTGEKFGNQRDTAFTRAHEACHNFFHGTYTVGEVKEKCRNIGSDKSVKFSVGLKGHNAHDPRHIGEAECYSGLKSQIANCDHGGKKTYGHWYYRADPNKGLCD